MPVFRSERMLEEKMKAVMREFGYTGGKVSVVCKSDSPKEANEKAKSAGLGSMWFLPESCEEIRDEGGLELFQKTEMAVCVDGENFLNVEDIRERLLR